MNNIAHFKLSSTFEANLGGGTLAYPNTSYIEDTATLHLLSSNSGKNYMYIEALEDDTLVSFKGLDQSSDSFFIDPYNTLEYSVDQQTWNTISTDGTATTINTGEKLYFRGECNDIRSNIDAGDMGIGTFLVAKKYNVGGNIMSLLFGDNFEDKTDLTGYDYVFAQLFIDVMSIMNSDESKLVSAENLLLPATALAPLCYAMMFGGCTSLTSAPELPATTLAASCYLQMFYGCRALTSTPELPATTLSYRCYDSMFKLCDSLITAPQLHATTLSNLCYSNMFYGCHSLVSVQNILPATTLTEGCYEGMFAYCVSLTTAPELPASILTEKCYYWMFRVCNKLNNITMLATDISATSCLDEWVSDVPTTGTFIKHPSMTSLPTGENGIPSGWTVVDYAA